MTLMFDPINVLIIVAIGVIGSFALALLVYVLTFLVGLAFMLYMTYKDEHRKES